MMRPFFQDETTTLYHADFREGVRALGLKFDAASADPPYGETSLAWDRWVDEWPRHVLDALKPTGSMWCFGSFRMFMRQRDQFAGWKQSQEIVWEKHNGSSFHADRFKRVHELAVHFYPESTPWGQVHKAPVYTNDATKRTLRRKTRPNHTGNVGAASYASEDGGPRLMRSVIAVRSCHGHAQNETQKPVGIILPLLRYCVPPRRRSIGPICRRWLRTAGGQGIGDTSDWL